MIECNDENGLDGAEEFQPVIGLEIHAQLHGASKLFSAAPSGSSTSFSSNSFSGDVMSSSWSPSNSRVALFDMATPGTLPRLNRQSVQQCLRTAMLLHCRVPETCRFDRKHYFYPDMPSGYQITQKDFPIAESGFFEFFVYPSVVLFASLTPSARSKKKKPSSCACISHENTYVARCGIERLQLETDSGKVLKYENRNSANIPKNAFNEMELIDLNRAGAALVEIVTAPDLRSAHEAACFVEQLRELLYFNAICEGEMHKGHLRVDANVSVSVNGKRGVRTEIKNINSFRFLRGAIQNEIQRQCEMIRRGEPIVEETRNLNSDTLTTLPMREKGDALDYRFTPEPNLPRLRIERDWVNAALRSVTFDLPYMRYIREFAFPPNFALQIAKDAKLKKFFDECLVNMEGMSFEKFHEWIIEFKRICEDNSQPFPPVNENITRAFRDIIRFEFLGRLTRAICFDLLKECVQQSKGFTIERIEEENLWRIHDVDEIGAQLDSVIRSRPELLETVLKTEGATRPGHKHFNKIRNEAVFESRKRIDVTDAERILSAKLNEKS